MEPIQGHFWQDVVLVALLVPYVIGVGIGTYYAQRQRLAEKNIFSQPPKR